MKLVRDAKTLKRNAIHSLRAAISAFNSFEDQGRITSVLLHSQHSCEMLLKAVLSQNKEKVFDRKTGKSIGFERCLGLCTAKYGLTDREAGIMRAIDRLRDAAQHWIVVVEEDMLYLHVRALITAFDDYLKRALEDDLLSHLPVRVLPVSTKPAGDFDFLVDREFKTISQLLQPGRRARDEARARIRALLAMEAVAVEEVEISETDINQIEKAIRAGESVNDVFPRLGTIGTSVEGDGPTVKVHFSKKEGAAVRFVGGDDPEGAAAIRNVDMQKKFYLGKRDLAHKLGISPPKANLLRQELGIDGDPRCQHSFQFGKQSIQQYSDNAFRKMKDWLDENSIEDLWKAKRSK